MIYQEKELTQEILESLEGQAYEVKRYGQIMRCSTGWIKEFGLQSPTTILLSLNPPSKEEIDTKGREFCFAPENDDFGKMDIYEFAYTQALIDIGFKKEEIK